MPVVTASQTFELAPPSTGGDAAVQFFNSQADGSVVVGASAETLTDGVSPLGELYGGLSQVKADYGLDLTSIQEKAAIVFLARKGSPEDVIFHKTEITRGPVFLSEILMYFHLLG